MLGVSLKQQQLPVLKKLFDRCPAVPMFLAYHLGSAPLMRTPESTYIHQVINQIKTRFLQGEQLMFLLEHLQSIDDCSMPICGFIVERDGCWQVRVSVLDVQNTDPGHYFREWLQKLVLYARRTGIVQRIEVLPNKGLRSVMKFHADFEGLRFDRQCDAYVLRLQQSLRTQEAA
jgi:hypothetical protein